jgi:hypothetical protein
MLHFMLSGYNYFSAIDVLCVNQEDHERLRAWKLRASKLQAASFKLFGAD